MILYFDCKSGISGDMILGSFVDAGVSLDELRKGLSGLPVKGYELKARKVKRSGFKGTKVDVVVKDKKTLRKYRDIKDVIVRSKLRAQIKKTGLEIFKRLFDAEAAVHGSRYDRIHLHELGAIDCIIDIFGTLIGLDLLKADAIISSPINLGGGTVKTEHGLLPVPAPATARLLEGVPIYSSQAGCELTTPTGAVLISSLADRFGPVPEMVLEKTGTGAGYKDFKEHPNILRVMIGRELKHRVQGKVQIVHKDDAVTVIETNIDDMNPQVYEYVMEKLFEAGALDVSLDQVIMKKGRPGIKLTVLCDEAKRETLSDIIFMETTSIGLRYYRAERQVLPRKLTSKKTKYGEVRVKVSALGNSREKKSLEYEDCKKIAKKFNVPLIEILKTIK